MPLKLAQQRYDAAASVLPTQHEELVCGAGQAEASLRLGLL
jgi:hypothetical protein